MKTPRTPRDNPMFSFAHPVAGDITRMRRKGQAGTGCREFWIRAVRLARGWVGICMRDFMGNKDNGQDVEIF